ncbi:MAG: SirB2 family protein [Xanthomonadales bacterium]|nr:SirB2 family protein [Xanthomonadales bacterium]
MATYYLAIKSLHILCVIASGGLFALRGLAVLAGAGWGNHAALRWLSYAIDTTLLTTALMLVAILQQYPFVHAWLTVKVTCLVAYIILGVLALRRAPTQGLRATCFAGALVVYAFIISVARTHDPSGFFTFS